GSDAAQLDDPGTEPYAAQCRGVPVGKLERPVHRRADWRQCWRHAGCGLAAGKVAGLGELLRCRSPQHRRGAGGAYLRACVAQPTADWLGAGAEPYDAPGPCATSPQLRVLHVSDLQPAVLLHGVDRRSAGLPSLLWQGRYAAREKLSQQGTHDWLGL